MSESDTTSEQHKGRGCAVAALLAMPFLYVLSLGPASAIHDHAPPFLQRMIEIVYEPLAVIVESTGTLELWNRVMGSYVDWWR